MREILPALLFKNLTQLEEQLKIVSQFDLVQIDVMDGIFVKNKTWRPFNFLKKRLKNYSLEIHLMVKNNDWYLNRFLKFTNISRIIFHWESLKKDKNFEKIINKLERLRVNWGLALNPETKIKEVRNILEKINYVLLLSVNPGWSGQIFNQQVLEKAQEIKKISKNIKIGLDGGINENNLPLILRYPISVINVNSAIFRHDNPEKQLKLLKKLVK